MHAIYSMYIVYRKYIYIYTYIHTNDNKRVRCKVSPNCASTISFESKKCHISYMQNDVHRVRVKEKIAQRKRKESRNFVFLNHICSSLRTTSIYSFRLELRRKGNCRGYDWIISLQKKKKKIEKKRKNKCNALDRDILDVRLCATCTGDLNRSKRTTDRLAGNSKVSSKRKQEKPAVSLAGNVPRLVFVITAPFDYNVRAIAISFHDFVCFENTDRKVL